MNQTVSIKDTRDKLADIVDRVSIGGDVFVITKFGKPKAMIVPVEDKNNSTPTLDESFGVFAKRSDMKDGNAWVKKTRAKMSYRNE